MQRRKGNDGDSLGAPRERLLVRIVGRNRLAGTQRGVHWSGRRRSRFRGRLASHGGSLNAVKVDTILLKRGRDSSAESVFCGRIAGHFAMHLAARPVVGFRAANLSYPLADLQQGGREVLLF